jgi:glyoxylase I family protein
MRRMAIRLENVAFSVDDLDAALEIAARHGCRPLRGPSGILVMLAEELKKG